MYTYFEKEYKHRKASNVKVKKVTTKMLKLPPISFIIIFRFIRNREGGR